VKDLYKQSSVFCIQVYLSPEWLSYDSKIVVIIQFPWHSLGTCITRPISEVSVFKFRFSRQENKTLRWNLRTLWHDSSVQVQQCSANLNITFHRNQGKHFGIGYTLFLFIVLLFENIFGKHKWVSSNLHTRPGQLHRNWKKWISNSTLAKC